MLWPGLVSGPAHCMAHGVMMVVLLVEALTLFIHVPMGPNAALHGHAEAQAEAEAQTRIQDKRARHGCADGWRTRSLCRNPLNPLMHGRASISCLIQQVSTRQRSANFMNNAYFT
ncbi:uncharacterized protein BDV14DRAFT_183540 [Aspergillus stella-maris]|uniref:uncharacterized protein n=1 Tax=Aspergillus stella-maris TaxID=1810926 RepID=UPI003CCDE6C4